MTSPRNWRQIPSQELQSIVNQHEALSTEIKRLQEAVQERDGVIEMVLLRELRLRELLAAFNERYRCECKHNRCKRCELNRQADELLGGKP